MVSDPSGWSRIVELGRWVGGGIPPPSGWPIGVPTTDQATTKPNKLNNMTERKRQIGTVLVAMLAILAIAAGGAAADTFDTSGTDATTTTSDVSGTSTTVDLRPGNSSESTYVEINATSENRTLTLKPVDSVGDPINYTVYENSTPTNESTAGAGNVHLSWNITHDEIEDVPRDVDGGDYYLQIWNGSTEELNTTVSFSHKGTSKTAVIHVADVVEATTHAVADRVEISETFGWFGAQEFWTDNGTTVSAWSGYTSVNGTNTSVEVHAVNTSTADAYDEAATKYEDGDWIRKSTLWVNGVPVKVYKNEAPSDAPDEIPYGVWHESSDELEVVHQGDAFTDVRTLQLRGGAGEAYGFGTLWSEFGVFTAVESLWMT